MTDFKQSFLNNNGPLVYDVSYDISNQWWAAAVSWVAGSELYRAVYVDKYKDKAIAGTILWMKQEFNMIVTEDKFEQRT